MSIVGLSFSILQNLSNIFNNLSQLKSQPRFIRELTNYCKTLEPFIQKINSNPYQQSFNKQNFDELDKEVAQLSLQIAALHKDISFISYYSNHAHQESFTKSLKIISAKNTELKLTLPSIEIIISFSENFFKSINLLADHYLESQFCQFYKEFNSPDAADLWITVFLFGKQRFIDINTLIYKLSGARFNENQKQWIKNILDPADDRIVSFEAFDQFFVQVWNLLKNRNEIIEIGSQQKKKENCFGIPLKKDLIMTLVYKSSPVHYSAIQKCYLNKKLLSIAQDFKLNNKFEFKVSGLQLPCGKFIDKKMKEKDCVTVGKCKSTDAILPDIHFQPSLKDISGNHAKIIYKNFNDIRKGYYFLDLANNASSLKVEQKPYLLKKNMVIKLYGGILFRVSAVFPSSAEELSTPNYFVLSIIDSDKEQFGDLGKFILDEKYPERKQIEEAKLKEKKEEEEKNQMLEAQRKIQATKKNKKKKTKEQSQVEAPKPLQPFIKLQLLETETFEIAKSKQFIR